MRSIYYNAKIYTNDSPEIATSMVVDDGKIIYIGDEFGAFWYNNEHTWLLDLSGEVVIPGFNDSHLHLYGLSMIRKQLKLHTATSIKDLIHKTKIYIEQESIASGNWVIGRGWNQDLFQGNHVFPTKQDLDSISTTHPIVLTRVCGHIMVVNSKALEACNIKEDTKAPFGGELDFEKGLLTEKALGLIYQYIPDPDDETLESMLTDTMNYANSFGVTTLQIDDLSHLNQSDYHRMLNLYQKLDQEGRLTTRLVLQCLLPRVELLDQFIKEGYPNQVYSPYLKVGPLKLLTDGTLGARTAAMRNPYHDDPSTKGLLTYPKEELLALVTKAHLANMSVAMHAIGDKAIEECLDVYEEVLTKHPRKDHRHAIIHCQITDDALLNRFKTLHVTAIVQPIFLDYDLHIVASRVGETLASTSYAFQSMLNKGVHLAIGTDAPIEDIDPFANLYASITRKDKRGIPEEGFYPSERLSVKDALYSYTAGCAYSSFDEHHLGKLKVGYHADFVVIDQDIFTIDPDMIPNTKALLTFVDGKKVYERRG